MEEFNKILEPIIRNENIINEKIQILGSNDKGDGYLGIVTAVEVKGDNKILKLIVKTAPKSEKLRKVTPIRPAFTTEINFYEKVYPMYRKFQLECEDIRPFIKIATCYGTSSKEGDESLVFENLKESGFKLWDRKKVMDKEHIILVLEEYGKLHAMSYALKEKKPALFKEISSNLPDNMQTIMYSADFKGMIDNILIKIQDIPQLKHEEKIISAIEHFRLNYLAFLQNCTPCEADQYAVITHGDCWCNNMLFKYEDNKNPTVPTSMRLIDWQLQKLGSPILDLSYFIYACADKNIFENLKQYLHIYHNALVTQLNKLDCNGKYISFENLFVQWKKFAKYGLLLAFIVVKLALSDKEEVPDFTDAAESNTSLKDAFDFESKSEKQYQSRVVDLAEHAYKIGVL